MLMLRKQITGPRSTVERPSHRCHPTRSVSSSVPVSQEDAIDGNHLCEAWIAASMHHTYLGGCAFAPYPSISGLLGRRDGLMFWGMCVHLLLHDTYSYVHGALYQGRDVRQR